MKTTRALQPSRIIKCNLNQGSYSPAFFLYDGFGITNVESVSIEAGDISAEQSLIHNDASFTN